MATELVFWRTRNATIVYLRFVDRERILNRAMRYWIRRFQLEDWEFNWAIMERAPIEDGVECDAKIEPVYKRKYAWVRFHRAALTTPKRISELVKHELSHCLDKGSHNSDVLIETLLRIHR